MDLVPCLALAPSPQDVNLICLQTHSIVSFKSIGILDVELYFFLVIFYHFWTTTVLTFVRTRTLGLKLTSSNVPLKIRAGLTTPRLAVGGSVKVKTTFSVSVFCKL